MCVYACVSVTVQKEGTCVNRVSVLRVSCSKVNYCHKWVKFIVELRIYVIKNGKIMLFIVNTEDYYSLLWCSVL